MTEQELIKGLLDLGMQAVLIAYIFRLDKQRDLNEAEHRRVLIENTERRSQDNNRWLSVFTGVKPDVAVFGQARSPTNVE
jgi:hypothetical protein